MAKTRKRTRSKKLSRGAKMAPVKSPFFKLTKVLGGDGGVAAKTPML
jgi:hypothetical protein